jgi:hypothetical protein
MYNSMGVGRRGRLTKGETDEIQHDVCTNGVQDSRKHTKQGPIEHSLGTRTNKPLLPFLSS